MSSILFISGSSQLCWYTSQEKAVELWFWRPSKNIKTKKKSKKKKKKKMNLLTILKKLTYIVENFFNLYLWKNDFVLSCNNICIIIG